MSIEYTIAMGSKDRQLDVLGRERGRKGSRAIFA